MELIDRKRYGDFKTEFFITPKVKEFLDNSGVALMHYLEQCYDLDAFHWYEHYAFDLLDTHPTKEWSEKKEKRKNLKVVFNGIVENFSEGKPEGFSDDIEFKESNFLGEDLWKVHFKDDRRPFAVKAIYLVDN